MSAFAYIDNTNDELRLLQWTGEGFEKIGGDTSFAATGNHALAPLGSDLLAYLDGTNDELQAYRFNGNTFDQVGSGLPLTNVSLNYITALNETDIAYVDGVVADTLTLYRWNVNSLSFAQVGNALALGASVSPVITAVSSSDVAFYDKTAEELQRYSFDGTDWAQVGSGQVVPIVNGTEVAMTALEGGDVVLYANYSLPLPDGNDLRRFAWNGDEYDQVSSGTDAEVGIGAVTAVNSTDVVLIGRSSDTVQRYTWNGTAFEATGNVHTEDNFGVPAITTLPQQWCTGAFASQSVFRGSMFNVNTPSYRVEIANSAHTFTEIGHDSMRAKITRKIMSRDNRFERGKLTLTIDNESKAYSPENSANLFEGNPINRPIRVKVTYQNSHHVRFSGTIDSVAVNPKRGGRKATVRASDIGKFLSRRKLTIPVIEETNAASLIAIVASHAGFTSSEVDVESMTDIVNVAWWDNEKASDVLDQIMEFGDYKAQIDSQGVLRVRNRYYANETNIVASYSTYSRFDYTFDSEDVANRVEVGFTPFQISDSVGTIAFISEAIPIAASGFAGVKLRYRDQDDQNKTVAAASVSAPVSSSDFQAFSNSDGTGTDRTATTSLVSFEALGASAVATFFNGIGRTVYLSKLQVQGYSVQELPDVSFVEQNSASQADYGLQDIEIQNALVGRYLHARDYARYLIVELPDPVAQSQVGIKNRFPDVFTNNLLDRMNLYETETLVGSLFVIEGLSEQINTRRGLEHEVTYNVRFWRDQQWLILDHPERGLLDTGRLAF